MQQKGQEGGPIALKIIVPEATHPAATTARVVADVRHPNSRDDRRPNDGDLLWSEADLVGVNEEDYPAAGVSSHGG